MKKEFNLSKKRGVIEDRGAPYLYFYPASAVKEFIRLEAKLIQKMARGKITLVKFCEERDALAGEELTG